MVFIVISNTGRISEPAFETEELALKSVKFSYHKYGDLTIIKCSQEGFESFYKACSETGKFERVFRILQMRVTDQVEHL